MKKIIVQIFIWMAVITALFAIPQKPVEAQNSQVQRHAGLDIDGNILDGRNANKVEIIVGKSEYEKKLEARESIGSKQGVARNVGNVKVFEQDFDLNGLRQLYKEAASRFGIDWKLIEAVHQIESGKSTGGCKSSSAGATGPMQFLPSTFRHYADNGADICNVTDAVFAAANLLASSGAAEGDIDSALFSYNHSRSYVEKVKEIMRSI